MKTMLHCWMNGPPVCVHTPACDGVCDEGMSTTCMLEKDHAENHRWSRDDTVSFTFTSPPGGETEGGG